MKKFLKDPAVTGGIAYWLGKILRSTLRVTVEAHPSYRNNQPYLFAFWHGKQLLPVLQLVHHNTLNIGLVSPSRDGNVLAVWLQKMGYDVIRGSSRADNVRSAVAVLQKVRAGASIGFAVDGPIGPIYQVKSGITYMAQKCGVPIVPLGSAFANKWVFEKAWDRYQIPKPFSRVGYYIGEPFMVEAGMDLEQVNVKLGLLLHRAEYKAAELLWETNLF